MKYGTVLNDIEWEIDLERKRLVSLDDPKLIKKLTKKGVKHLRELIKNDKNKM